MIAIKNKIENLKPNRLFKIGTFEKDVWTIKEVDYKQAEFEIFNTTSGEAKKIKKGTAIYLEN